MIISFNGDQGSGKSTTAKMIADSLGYSWYCTGKIFRDMAKEKGLTLPEFQKLQKEDPSFDKKVDDYVVKLSKENNNFVIDSRMAWHFIPQSLKIYLKVNDQEAAKRIFKEIHDESRRNELPDAISEEEIIINLKERKERDDDRYQRYYGVNIREENNYDFVLDTTGIPIGEVYKKIMNFINSRANE